MTTIALHEVLNDVRDWLTAAVEFHGMSYGIGGEVEVTTSRNAIMATSPHGEVAVAAMVDNTCDRALMLTHQDQVVHAIHRQRHLPVPLDRWPNGPGADLARHLIDRWVTDIAERQHVESAQVRFFGVEFTDMFSNSDPRLFRLVYDALTTCRVFSRHQPPVAGWHSADLHWRDPRSGAMILTAHRDSRRMVISMKADMTRRAVDVSLGFSDEGQPRFSLTQMRIDSDDDLARIRDEFEAALRQELTREGEPGDE